MENVELKEFILKQKPKEVLKMSDILQRDPIFIFVFTYLIPLRDMPLEIKIKLTEKICNKLIKFGHDKKTSDFKEIYVRYYMSGYLKTFNFKNPKIDRAFLTEDYQASKNFFIEVYYGNSALINEFIFEYKFNPFSNQQNQKEYLKWIENNFKVYYDDNFSDCNSIS